MYTRTLYSFPFTCSNEHVSRSICLHVVAIIAAAVIVFSILSYFLVILFGFSFRSVFVVNNYFNTILLWTIITGWLM